MVREELEFREVGSRVVFEWGLVGGRRGASLNSLNVAALSAFRHFIPRIVALVTTIGAVIR